MTLYLPSLSGHRMVPSAIIKGQEALTSCPYLN